MENDCLATELLHSLKSSCRRLFIAFVIVLAMLFATNLAWLYAWNLPSDETSQTYDIDAQDNGNAIYNDSGEVSVDGKN